MRAPLTITFQGLDESMMLNDLIEKEAERLNSLFRRIISMHVQVGPRSGWPSAQVCIDITVAGGHVVVKKMPRANHTSTSATAAIREAFDRAEHQLADYNRVRYRMRLRLRNERIFRRIPLSPVAQAIGF